MRRYLILACVALAACSSSDYTAPQDKAETLVISNEGGGNVAQYLKLRADLLASGNPVQLRGYIASAATVLMTLPSACMGRGAVFGFHAPSTEIDLPLIGQVALRGVEAAIGATYRAGIKERWDTKWRHSTDVVRISAAQAKRLDPELRYCL